MSQYAQIIGWGHYAPPKVLTNDDMSKIVDTSDEWIRTRTGISERHIAEGKESTATMATRAAQNAIAVADINPRSIDLIIVATLSPDYPFPAVACLVQDALGVPHAAAFDLSAGCTGFVYALTVASQMIGSGAYNTALVVGSETLSRMLDWTDRTTCVLFGDGAGAVVLRASDEPTGLLGSTLGSDGSGAELLYIPAGGARMPASQETVEGHQHSIKMNGSEVYRFAVDAMTRVSRQVLEKTGVTIDDLALVIPHQANERIISAASRALKLPPEKVYKNVDRYGNTSSASVPIALSEAAAQGRIRDGDHIMLVGFGAGLTWGAAIVQWGVPPPSQTPWFLRTLIGRALARFAIVRSLGKRLGLRLRTMANPEQNGSGRFRD